MSSSEYLRCFQCGARQRRDAPCCTQCGTPFLGICNCGVEHGLFESSCSACGLELTPPKLPFRRHPWVRFLRRLAVVLFLGGTVVLAVSPRPEPVWRLKEKGTQCYEKDDFAAAALYYGEVTERRPGDAEAWFMLGLAQRRMGAGEEAYLPLVERALALRPDMAVALRLLALVERDRGRVDRALEYAAQAVRLPGARGEDHRLLAELELWRPDPDLPRAAASLRRARAEGADGLDIRLLRAEVLLRLHGLAPGQPLPETAAEALRDAGQALAEHVGVAPPELMLIRARIHLALGEVSEAFRQADTALAAVPADGSRMLRSRLLRTRGEAIYVWTGRGRALQDLAEALRLAPTAEAAAEIVAFLSAVGGEEDAESLLIGAAELHDPVGALRAVLAHLQLSRGDLPAALQSVELARRSAPGNALAAVLEGDVHRARGRTEEARLAYEEAARLAPGLLVPSLRLALLGVEGEPAAGVRMRAARDAAARLEALAPRHGDEPALWLVLGSLRMEAGEPAEAVTALRRCTEIAPADATGWLLLAEALGASLGEEGLSEVAAVYARARALRPTDGGLAVREARARMRLWDGVGATHVCSTFLAIRPDDPDVLRERAAARLQTGAYHAAAADLERVARLTPDDPQPLLLAADARFLGGDRVTAATLLDRASDLVDRRASLGVGGPVERQAVDVLRAIHDVDPRRAVRSLAVRGASVLLVEVQLQMGMVDGAAETARRLLAADPANREATRYLVLALLDGPTDPERLEECRSVLAALARPEADGLGNLLDGRILLAQAQFERAAVQLRRAAAIRPQDPFSHLLLGEALYRSGDLEGCLEPLRRAVVTPGAPRRFRAIVAERLLHAGLAATDTERALDLVEAAHRLDPGSPMISLERARRLLLAGKLRPSAEVAEAALRSVSRAPECRLPLLHLAALCRWSLGESEAVMGHLDSMEGTGERGSRLAGCMRGHVLLRSGRLEEAERQFRDLDDADPETALLVVLGRIECALAREDVDRAANLARLWRVRHETPAAAQGIAVIHLLGSRGAVEAAERETAAYRRMAPADPALAAEHVALLGRLGRTSDAVASAVQLGDAVPESGRLDALLLQASAEIRFGGDVARGLRLARDVVARTDCPQDTRWYARVLEAEALLVSGDVDGAAAAARPIAAAWASAAGPAPGDGVLESRGRFVLGVLAAVGGRIDEAAAELGRCLELDPANTDARNNLAWVFSQRRETAARAHAMALEITRQRPDRADYWDTRAVAAEAAGETDDAAASWQRARVLLARADASERADVDLRYAAFLRREGRDRDAQALARDVAAYAAGTDAARRADVFLR